jgi:quercetin dioxygenase-like cupin family protein
MNLVNDPGSAANLKRVRAGEGEAFDVVGVKFHWKAKGKDTQFAFSILEQTLLPNDGVMAHSHPYAEVFYILEGAVSFRRIAPAGEDEAELRCTVGDTLLVPAGTVHAFVNKGEGPARILGVSTHQHQRFFDAVQEEDAAAPFGAMPLSDAIAKIAKIGQAHGMFFEPLGD